MSGEVWRQRLSVAELWCRAVATGVLITAAIVAQLGPPSGNVLNVVAPATALLAGLVSFGLGRAVRTDRGWRRPPPADRWLGLGSLAAYGLGAAAWLALGSRQPSGFEAVRWLVAGLGVLAAATSPPASAGQAGAGLWRGPLAALRCLAGSLVGGAGLLLIVASLSPATGPRLPSHYVTVLGVGLLTGAALALVDLWLPRGRPSLADAAARLRAGDLAPTCWGGFGFIGTCVPLGMLYVSKGLPGPFPVVGSVAALVGLAIQFAIWWRADQERVDAT